MARIIVSGEQPFQVLAHSFAVSPSASGYTLQYSADGSAYTSYPSATPAGENLIVNGIAKLMYFKLKDNTSEVAINY